MPKTMLIESDRAVELAEARARIEGKTVSKVVEEALEHSSTPAGANGSVQAEPEEREARLARILERARALRATLPADVTSDHSWLYDEHGLPR